MTTNALHWRAARSIAAARMLLGAKAGVLLAQAGSTTDIIVGHITSPEGAPVIGARIDATSGETGLMRSTVSRATGQYTIVFPDGGGVYRPRCARLGSRR